MTKRTAAHVDLARRLLGSSEGGAVTLYATLSGRLAPLIGLTGFRAVFGRSVKLTRIELADLDDVFAGIDAAYETAQCHAEVLGRVAKLPALRASDTAAALYGTLLALLGALVGERLVWQVLQRAFPALEQDPTKESK